MRIEADVELENLERLVEIRKAASAVLEMWDNYCGAAGVSDVDLFDVGLKFEALRKLLEP
jgi:hypothetical protein